MNTLSRLTYKGDDGKTFVDCLDPCCGPLILTVTIKEGQTALGAECPRCGFIIDGCEDDVNLMVKWNQTKRGFI